jgi:hypothetical protein
VCLNSSNRDKRLTDPLELIELLSGSVKLRYTGTDILDHYFTDVLTSGFYQSGKTRILICISSIMLYTLSGLSLVWLLVWRWEG